MNRLPPIGNASFEKYTSLSKTIISSFYGQLINATIYLSESDFSTVFRFTTFEEFNDLNSFWDRSHPPYLKVRIRHCNYCSLTQLNQRQSVSMFHSRSLDILAWYLTYYWNKTINPDSNKCRYPQLWFLPYQITNPAGGFELLSRKILLILSIKTWFKVYATIDRIILVWNYFREWQT